MKNWNPNPSETQRKLSRIVLFCVITGVFTGCARNPAPSRAEPDKYRRFNTVGFKMNKNFDAWITGPITRGYQKFVPLYARTRVTNFFNNLSDLNTIPNQFLQAKPTEGWSDVQRFTINSTAGLLGLYDVASHFGFERHDEDLGQTLGVYGVPPGPYLVIPLVGPTTGREFFGNLTTSLISRILFVGIDPTLTTSLRVLDTVDNRSRSERGLRIVEETALDEYIFIREAYIQQQNFELYDGNPPMEEMDLFHEDDELMEDDEFLMDDSEFLGEAEESPDELEDWELDLESELLEGTEEN